MFEQRQETQHRLLSHTVRRLYVCTRDHAHHRHHHHKRARLCRQNGRGIRSLQKNRRKAYPYLPLVSANTGLDAMSLYSAFRPSTFSRCAVICTQTKHNEVEPATSIRIAVAPLFPSQPCNPRHGHAHGLCVRRHE